MSTEKIHDYLSKQLSIENAVVTYRLLSREMEIHVNAAKKELENYRHDVESYATYLVSGLLHPTQSTVSQEDRMDVDGGDEGWDEDYDEDDDVQELQTLLVGEEDLENYKAQFAEIYSVHVYSLSPARLLDADLICSATDKVRLIDASDKGPDLALKVGKIIGPHVVQAAPVGKGKGKALVAASSSSKINTTVANERAKEKEKETPKPGALEQKNSKTSEGKLDWSKAKSKEDTKKGTEKHRKATAETSAPKRGVKRNHVLSESEEDEKPKVAPPAPAPKPANKASSLTTRVRVKKGIVLSDDDDDVDTKPLKSKGKGKIKAEDSEEEMSLRVMMDIDDEEVEKVSHVISKSSLNEYVKDEEEEGRTEGESMYEEQKPEVIKPKPRKRKEKKVIPVGKNGLKKKKILKSRMRMDDKGYMVTEDYSSYESVDEEVEVSDVPAEKGSKKKGNAKSTETKAKPKTSSSKELVRKASSSGSLATKARTNEGSTKSVAGQKNLMNFFGKKS